MDFESIYKKTSTICSQQECCISDIKEKLLKWGIEENTSEKVISSLIKDKFIDEKRYASNYAKEKNNFNGWGKQKIIWNLKQKTIPDEIIKSAIEAIETEDYNKILLNLLRQKSQSISNHDPYKKKVALARFAVSRGFGMSEVMEIMKDAI